VRLLAESVISEARWPTTFVTACLYGKVHIIITPVLYYLFIYALFNDVVSSSGNMAANDRKCNE
jgi:hypothetical protein